jgi:hypothetical protein
MRLSKSVKSEEKSSAKKIFELIVKFQDNSELTFQKPDDEWITSYNAYLLVLHGNGRVYIPWKAIKKVLERER